MFSFDPFIVLSLLVLCLGYLHIGDKKSAYFLGICAYFGGLFRQVTALPVPVSTV